MFSNKYQLWNTNHLVTMKNTSCYWQILAVSGTLYTWQPEIIFLFIRKHNFFTSEGYFSCWVQLNRCKIRCRIQWRQMIGCRWGLNTLISFPWCYTWVDVICIWGVVLVLICSNVFIIKLRRGRCSFRITCRWCTGSWIWYFQILVKQILCPQIVRLQIL